MGEVIKPLGNRVVVKKAEEIKQTAGGIILPDNAGEKPHRGTVFAVGPGKWNHAEFDHEPMPIKPGDEVLYPQYQGVTVKVNDEDYLVFDLDQLLAVIEKVVPELKIKDITAALAAEDHVMENYKPIPGVPF